MLSLLISHFSNVRANICFYEYEAYCDDNDSDGCDASLCTSDGDRCGETGYSSGETYFQLDTVPGFGDGGEPARLQLIYGWSINLGHGLIE